MRSWFMAWLLVGALCAAARAEQEASTAAAHFAEGLAHARSGQWSSALASFDLCYRLAPERLSALFNLAGAQLRTGKLLHAHANYHRLRASQSGALGSAHRRAVERQLALIKERIPRLRLQIEGLKPDQRVLLDQTRLYPNELDMELWVDPGEHVLAVHGPAGVVQVRQLVLLEAQYQHVTFSVPP